MEKRLLVIKKSSKEPETGDLFVVQPKEGIYYYGKVIKARVESKDLSFKGWYLVFLYDFCASRKNSNINLDGTPLLIAPLVINKRLWTMGYFETIGKLPVTKYDLSIDFGFWDVLRKKYYDLQGNEMSHKPQYSSVFGLGSFGIVIKEIYKALSQKESKRL